MSEFEQLKKRIDESGKSGTGDNEMTTPIAQGPVDVNVRPAQHHIWCNFSAAGPAHECKQCKSLYDRYPMEGTTVDELAAQHFPDAVKRT